MADPVVTNIIKSGAIVWKAPEGETPPDPDVIAAGAAWGGNWERIGFTKAPLAFAFEDERSEIDVEEYLANVDEYRISERPMIETELAELTADYLQLVFSGTVVDVAEGASNVGTESLEVGNTAVLDKFAWGFEGIRYDEDDGALPIRFFMYRGVAKLNGNLEFSKREDQYTGIPLQVKGQASVANNGKSFKIERVTAAATGS